MILGLDTDVLVHWVMGGAAHHRVVRRSIARSVDAGWQLGLTPQVLHEFLHVCTDPRRFEQPIGMQGALDTARALWDGKEIERIIPTSTVVHRTLELLEEFGLGRKRILDTSLAATFEGAGVTHVATFNTADFAVFPFLKIVDPTKVRRNSS